MYNYKIKITSYTYMLDKLKTEKENRENQKQMRLIKSQEQTLDLSTALSKHTMNLNGLTLQFKSRDF